MKRSNLLLAIIPGIILLLGSLVFGGLAFLRGVVGLLFVLFVPGWTITAALFPGREFAFPERLALATGFSIAAAMLTGVGLHLTPWGLQTGIWFTLLAGIAALTGLVGWRKNRPGLAEVVSRRAGLQPIQAGLMVLSLLIAGLSIAIARQPAPAAGFQGYTSLWIYPIQIEGGFAVQLGVSSNEFETMSYRLELQQDGRLIGEYPEITLAPGESTQVVARLDPDLESESPVEALLFRLDHPDEPYRQVTWWPGSRID